MDNQKRRFKATVDGKTYTIVGNRSESHMKAVTEIMNEQLAQIKKLAPQTSKEEAAILLAFNAISDQLDVAEKEAQAKKNAHFRVS
ncbi:cell division protein ZapA [Secundilactobacillus kimchicus]|uniref:cell division protein ZapA n=1 Tax=Secundilactobacillus kimchicus TaxID=528209 RepID=UPI0006E183C8|nr:cell division protein ZapA [Secundilactobacillus kimchicus]